MEPSKMKLQKYGQTNPGSKFETNVHVSSYKNLMVIK